MKAAVEKLSVALMMSMISTACATSATGVADAKALASDSEKLVVSLRRSGLLSDDPSSSRYLVTITDSLYPELGGALRPHIIKSRQPNAFVLPTGDFYFSRSLLALLDNEAQLASVIAHEGAHYVAEDALHSLRRAKQSLLASEVFGTLTGTASLTSLAAYSSIMGYSRERERAADMYGFARLRRAGYEVREAPKAFDNLGRFAAHMEFRDPVFFASHPRMSERIASFEALIPADEPRARVGTERFQASTAVEIEAYIEDELAADGFEIIIYLFEEESMAARFGPRSAYFLGMAYLLRDQPDDNQRAEAEFRQAMQVVPDYAPPYGALGRLLMKDGRRREALALFRAYLALAPDAADRTYIKNYINGLSADL